MIPQKRTPYSWFYIPRYPHHMKFLMQESSISLQILGRCPPKISHDTPWLSVLKQPGWSPWKKLKWTKQENTRQKHNKHTNQYLLFVAIRFLLLLSHSLILFLASLCAFGFSFWFWFLLLQTWRWRLAWLTKICLEPLSDKSSLLVFPKISWCQKWYFMGLDRPPENSMPN